MSELQEQLHVLSAQRDSQALEISKYKQQLEHNSLAMINLQGALEQLQKGKFSALNFNAWCRLKGHTYLKKPAAFSGRLL